MLAYMTFPAAHLGKISFEQSDHNGEIRHRTDVVGIFPNKDVIVRISLFI